MARRSKAEVPDVYLPSAAVELYAPTNERRKSAIRYIVEQRKAYKQAVLLIPNFCIVEVFNTLARKHFRDSKLDEEEYGRCLHRFRDDIHWGETLYVYNLNRYHVIATDEIIPMEHHLEPENERDRLSAFDILIIAMACELVYVNGREQVFLVTCDRRIRRVIDRLKTTDPHGWTIPGPLGEPKPRRCIPPNVYYLPSIQTGGIKAVERQPSLSLPTEKWRTDHA